MTLPTLPSSLRALYCRMVSMDSCLALSMNPQALLPTLSSVRISADSCTAGMSLPRSWPLSTSLSCMFLEQPNVTTFTRGLRGAATAFVGFVFMWWLCSLEQRVDKFFLVEQLEVVHFLSYADVLHGDFELVGNADDHAPLGGAVELGKGQRIDIGGLRKLFALFDGVLSGGGIEHEQDFVGRTRHNLLHHLLDLGELIHQGHLVVESAGGVDDGHVVAIGHRRFYGIVRHGGRV